MAILLTSKPHINHQKDCNKKKRSNRKYLLKAKLKKDCRKVLAKNVIGTKYKRIRLTAGI